MISVHYSCVYSWMACICYLYACESLMMYEFIEFVIFYKEKEKKVMCLSL